jgi:hypothetical protein
MGFLDMFDNPDIMSTLMGGLPSSMATPQPQPQMSGAPSPPMEQNTGLNVHDQLPPGQPAGPTMAGVGFPPPGLGEAAAAVNPSAPPMPPPGPPPGQGYGGGLIPPGQGYPAPPGQGYPAPPGQGYAGGPIPTRVGPIQGQPVALPPPSVYAGGPPTSTNGNLAAALGIANRDQRIGNAISTGMAGLGRGLSAVGAARPGASGAQMFAAGAGGALEGGAHQINQQQAQARQTKMDNFLMSSNAFKDWIAARAADNKDDETRFRGDYFRARARAAMTGGGGARGMQTPEQQAAFVEGHALIYRDQIRKGNEARIKNPELGKPYTDEEIDQKIDNYRKEIYKQHFPNANPKDSMKLATAGIDEKNPLSLKDITTQDQFDRQVPINAWYDTGAKFDASGNYTFTRQNGTKDVHHGEPGASVILQRMPVPQQQTPQQQSQNLEDSYLMSNAEVP